MNHEQKIQKLPNSFSQFEQFWLFFYFWTKRFKLNQCAVGKMALTTCWGLNIIEKIAKSRFGYPRVCYLWSVVKSTIYLRMYPMDQLFCDKRTNAHSNDWIWPQWYNTDKKERTYVDIWLIYNLTFDENFRAILMLKMISAKYLPQKSWSVGIILILA